MKRESLTSGKIAVLFAALAIASAALLALPHKTEAAQFPPIVDTASSTHVTAAVVTIHGNLTNVGNPSTTGRGFLWGTSPTLQGGDTASTTEYGAFSVGAFSANITETTFGVPYYFRAYATTTLGAAYGDIQRVRAVFNKPPNNLGLVGYWSFDDGVGTKATDFSGRGNVGTLAGGVIPTWVNGKRGKALNFDGDEARVDVGTPASLNPVVKTISAWIYPRSVGAFNFGTIMNSQIGASAQWIFQACSNDATECPGATNTLVYVHTDGSSIVDEWRFPANTLQFNKWQHVVVTFDASTVGNTPSFYVNGSAVTATQTQNNLEQNGGVQFGTGGTNPKYIGSDPVYDAAFDGYLDDVRIYNRTLSASEVANLYGQNTAGATQVGASSATLQNGSSLSNGLVGLWTFDGADIAWTSQTAGTATDRSGNGNSGTLTNMSIKSTAEGKLGQALNFDGTDDYVNAGAGASLNISGAITLSAWVYSTNNLDWHTVVENDDGTENTLQYAFGIHDSNIFLQAATGGNFQTDYGATNLQTNTWYHIVATRDAANTATQIYINGTPDNVTNEPVRITIPTVGFGNTLFGDCCGGFGIGRFAGKMDDVRIYNRALTPAEVRQLYLLGGVKSK